MNFEDEYVFNNGIYEKAVRNLKATFFDVLSFSDSLDNDDEDFSDKLSNLKTKMNDIIDSIEDLDSFKKDEDDNDVIVKSDEDIQDVDEVEPIDYGEDAVVSQEEDTVEEQASEVITTDAEVEKTEDNISNDGIDEKVDDTNDVQTSEVDTDILSFKKDNDDIVKAILVSDNQYNKLNNSKESQVELLNQVNFFEENNREEESIVAKEEDNSSENLTEKAVMLYKQGKTKEAQAIMDKINSMNRFN